MDKITKPLRPARRTLHCRVLQKRLEINNITVFHDLLYHGFRVKVPGKQVSKKYDFRMDAMHETVRTVKLKHVQYVKQAA